MIQIDATMIAGILILLTIGSLSPGILDKGVPSYLTAIGGIYGATAIVIAPFAFSAIMVILARIVKENREYRNKIKPLIQNKISLLNKKIDQEKNNEMKLNLDEEKIKLQKSILKMDEKLEKYDELKIERDQWNGRMIALGLLILGFTYLIYIIYIIAQSGIPIKN